MAVDPQSQQSLAIELDLAAKGFPEMRLVSEPEPSGYWGQRNVTDDDAKEEIHRTLRQLASGHYDPSLAAGALWCLIVSERERAVDRFATVLRCTRPLPPMPAQIAIRDVLLWAVANQEVVDGRAVVDVAKLLERWGKRDA